jgi:two-component system sensor histidine kinase UhpB
MAPKSLICPSCRAGGHLPIWGDDPIFVMTVTRSHRSLVAQVLAVNVLLVVATLFAASAAANLDLGLRSDRWTFGLLAMTIILVLLVNITMLRRRFSPLQNLIDHVEATDPSELDGLTLPAADGIASEEVERLSLAFRRLLARVDEEQRRSGRLVLRAQEEERRRLARDLHDEVNQALTAILLRLEALSHGLAPAQAEELGEVKKLVNQAMSELLQLARQLRPTALDDHGLLPALATQVRRFAAQTGIEADLRTSGTTESLTADQEIAVYRVAQEALANVARHAGASRVELDLSAADAGGLELRVRDDGGGFDTRIPGGGLGLGGMAERARLVGGELDIESQPGSGTELVMRVP